jgi:hypothetical protein
MGLRPSRQSRRGFMGLAATAVTFATCCCSGLSKAFGQSSAETGGISGGDKSAKSKALETGADVLQSLAPVNAINMYLNGFHFYADDMGRQVEAHHYCHHVTEDFFQCVIYDGNKSSSRLIGVEYIVSEKLFKTLPEDEKLLWHSHRHETTSGELVMPEIPMQVEHTAIATLVNSYGKTWHTWQIDKDAALPLGIPQLMMGFTRDGQLDAERIARRDKELGVSTAKERESREALAKEAGPVLPGADAWQSGTSAQLALQKLSLKNRRE